MAELESQGLAVLEETKDMDVVERDAGGISTSGQSEVAFDLNDLAGWYDNNYGSSAVALAMNQTAFMLCVDVITQDIAKSTPRLRRRNGTVTSEVVDAKKHPLAEMLALDPNRRHTWFEWTQMMVAWLAMESNAYGYIVRDGLDDVQEIIPLQPGRVQSLVYGREIFYQISAGTQQEQALLGFSQRRVPERDMIHVRSRLFDGMAGFSTLQAGRRTLDTGKEMLEFQETLFGDDGQLRGVFTKEGTTYLPEEAFQRLRNQFRTLMNRYRQLTEPIILEGGWKFEKTSSNPKEMEFAQQLASQVVQIGRLMRIPPHKLFAMDGTKYDNMETSEKIYVGDTLVPICMEIEQRMARQLLTRKERLDLFIEYDRSEMTLRDTQRETERVIKATERGLLLLDEGRAALGYNPYPNGQGQVRLIPVNMSVVDLEGNVVVQASANQQTEEAASSEAEPEKEQPAKSVLRLV